MNDEIQTAIAELRAAFPPHPLDVQSAFEEWGRTYNDGARFKTEAHGKRWDELPPQFLEFHHDALLFLEPAVLAQVVPAYLATALRRDPELDMLPRFLIGVLTRSEDNDNERDRFDARFGGLPAAQQEAIAHALQAWEQSFENPDRRRPISEALARYWRFTRGG